MKQEIRQSSLNIHTLTDKISDACNIFTKNLDRVDTYDFNLKLHDIYDWFKSISHYANGMNYRLEKYGGGSDLKQKIAQIVALIMSKVESENTKIVSMIPELIEKIKRRENVISINREVIDSIKNACLEIVRLKNTILYIV